MPDPVEPGGAAGGRRFVPVLIVVGVAAVAFFAALVVFRGGGDTKVPKVAPVTSTTAPVASTPASSGTGCVGGGPASGYTVTMSSDPDPPRAEGTTFHLAVRHDGKIVTGAKVCVIADMTEMHHAGIIDVAKEASSGDYDATLKFGMRGPYAASVVIIEPGHPAVTVPLSFQVD